MTGTILLYPQPGRFEKALAVVERLQPELGSSGYTSDSGVAKVSIVGAGMASNPVLRR